MTDSYGAAPQAGSTPYASWGRRVVASIVDALPTILVLVVLTALFGDNDTSGSTISFQLSGLPFVIYLLFALGWLVFNTGAQQGRTGQSLGKKLLGISLVHAGTGQPLGFGLSLGRSFVHFLDAIPCFIGFLWPLWDRDNRTFADMILDTRVVRS